MHIHQVVFQVVGVVDTVSTWPEEVINDGSSTYVTSHGIYEYVMWLMMHVCFYLVF